MITIPFLIEDLIKWYLQIKLHKLFKKLDILYEKLPKHIEFIYEGGNDTNKGFIIKKCVKIEGYFREYYTTGAMIRDIEDDIWRLPMRYKKIKVLVKDLFPLSYYYIEPYTGNRISKLYECMQKTLLLL